MSQEEILEQAAWLVAQSINPDGMGKTPDEVDVAHFVELFKKKAGEMLAKKEERLLLGVGSYLNKEKTLFTEDLKIIIDYIEEVAGKKFCFFNGILIYFGAEDIAANWIPDWPV